MSSVTTTEVTGRGVTRRRLWAGGAGAAGAATLAECGLGGGGASGGAAQGSELDQPVTIEYLSRQPYDEAFDAAISRFRARFPKAEVTRDQQANNGAFNQKLETLVAAGTPPDVAFAVGSTYHGQGPRST